MQNRAKKQAYLHELFGFDTPVKGFEDPIPVFAEKTAFVPDVNPDFVFDKDMVGRVLRSYGARENIMLTGEKGTGKTTFVQQFCARLNIPLMTICGGPGLDESYLMGGKTIEASSVKSVDGLISYCLRWGINILIDEIAAIKPSVLVSINDVLNGDQTITLKHHGLDPSKSPVDLVDQEGSLSITRHKAFRLFACDNTGGKVNKDPRYAGVMAQNTAVRSRFTCFGMGFMHPALELKALTNIVGEKLPVSLAKQMIELAMRVRAAFEIGEMYDTLSFRELKRWASKSLVYGSLEDEIIPGAERKLIPDVHNGFVDAVYTGMEESDQDMVRQLFELVFNTTLSLPNEYKNTSTEFLKLLDSEELNWDFAA